MRNNIPVNKLLQRVYVDGSEEKKLIPSDRVPALLKQARPLREFVKVDHSLPGCPPPAKAILGLITELLEGRKADTSTPVKFG
jgi:NAD-reducing hydrogenase small subunit